MLEGTLVAESIRSGASLRGVRLVVRKIVRRAPERTAKYQPDIWTNIDFEIDEADGDTLADALAEVLDEPGWYADFRSDSEIYVVFPGQVFRYPRGDKAARAKAQQHGRRVGVPGYQLDWPV